jgi:hypothetical protein
MAVANQPLPERIVDRWLESTLTNALRQHDPSVLKVEVDGDAIILVHKREAFTYRAGPNLEALRAAMRWDRTDKHDCGPIDLLPWDEQRENLA